MFVNKGSRRTTAVVVIVHKAELSFYEKKSLLECLKQLKIYDIFLVHPANLDITNYSFALHKLIIMPVDGIWLKDYESFNRMKINFWFYNKFKAYQNILFYELDSWIFSDQLIYWENLGFDYIGAPWILINQNNDIEVYGIGNGGFSLRNVSKHLKLIRSLRIISCLKKFEKFNDFGILPQFLKLLHLIINSIKTQSYWENNFTGQEDIFWTQDLPKILIDFNSNSKTLNFLYKILIYKEFKIADFNNACKFSFEMYPEKLYELNDNKLPFGCHAWQKYNSEFWKLHI